MASTQSYQAEVITLLYHDVTDDPAASGFQFKGSHHYKHDTACFRDNLAAIEKSGRIPGLVGEIDLCAARRYLLLTFDDGGKSALYTADQLDRMGWKGHFFVTTEVIGHPCFVSKADIRDLRMRGHSIGSHSHTHPNVCWNLSYGQMLKEWRQSCDILAQIIREEITVASVPGGEMDFSTEKSAANAGIKFLFTSEPEVRPFNTGELVTLGRLCPKRSTPVELVADWAKFKGLKRQLVLRKGKQVLKKAAGPFLSLRYQNDRGFVNEPGASK